MPTSTTHNHCESVAVNDNVALGSNGHESDTLLPGQAASQPWTDAHGARLRERRRQFHYSQAVLAQLIGCSRAAVSFWECCSRVAPQYSNLQTIDAILGTDFHNEFRADVRITTTNSDHTPKLAWTLKQSRAFRAARQRALYSQTRLAGALEVSVSRVCQIENYLQPPSLTLLKQADEILGTDFGTGLDTGTRFYLVDEVADEQRRDPHTWDRPPSQLWTAAHGVRLRERRLQFYYSQPILAQLIGCSPSVVSCWESCAGAAPQYSNLQTIDAILGTDFHNEFRADVRITTTDEERRIANDLLPESTLSIRWTAEDGAQLRQARMESGYSMTRLANAIGYRSQGHISDIERGLMPPTPSFLIKVDEVLGTSFAVSTFAHLSLLGKDVV
ncbi:MAG: helix-turn-helix transcriptional regulator [Ferrimicrobium sp.]